MSRVWSPTRATTAHLPDLAIVCYFQSTGAHHRPHTTTETDVFHTSRRHPLSGQADKARRSSVCRVRGIEVSCQRRQRCFSLDHCQPASDSAGSGKSQQGNDQRHTTHEQLAVRESESCLIAALSFQPSLRSVGLITTTHTTTDRHDRFNRQSAALPLAGC